MDKPYIFVQSRLIFVAIFVRFLRFELMYKMVVNNNINIDQSFF